MGKKEGILLDMTSGAGPGPGLLQLLDAQRREDGFVAWPELERYARALVEACEEVDGHPLVWPVGRAAERLAGAAALFGGAGFRVRRALGDVSGELVIVTAVTAVTPLPLVTAAKQAMALGARKVFAAGVDVEGVEECPPGVFAGYIALVPDCLARRQSA